MIQRLTLENFRNFGSLDLSFNSSPVIIAGANGKGKTSVLEALFFLSNLRSFRTVKIGEMKKLGSDSFRIACTLSGEKWDTRLEVQYTAANVRQMKLDGVPVARSSEFAGKFKTIAFLPDDSSIIGGTSQLRRRFLDMFISMVDNAYFMDLQQYSAALKVRNHLLKMEKIDMDVLNSYHPILAEHGAAIVRKRNQYIHILKDSMKLILSEIRPEFRSFTIRMKSSKDTESADQFLEKLNTKFEYDQLRGFTTLGPHLDDFDFIANEKNLRIYGSNGQKRITSFALKMAEFDIVGGKNTIVIVDDATGDLDYKTKNAFLDKVQNAGQLFFAFTDIENTPFFNRSQIISLEQEMENGHF